MWNNRVFEVLASGGLLISDEPDGLADELGDGLVLTEGGEQTAELIERYLAAPAERQRIAEVGRRLVMGRYTYDHSAARMRDHYFELCERLGIAPMGGAQLKSGAGARRTVGARA